MMYWLLLAFASVVHPSIKRLTRTLRESSSICWKRGHIGRLQAGPPFLCVPDPASDSRKSRVSHGIPKCTRS